MTKIRLHRQVCAFIDVLGGATLFRGKDRKRAEVFPMGLMATSSVAPILVRYMVRTDQLESRFPGVTLPMLLSAMASTATKFEWPLMTVAQTAPLARQDAAVDEYLDALQPHVQAALKGMH